LNRLHVFRVALQLGVLLDAHGRFTDGVQGEQGDVGIDVEGLAIGPGLQATHQDAAVLLHGLLELAEDTEVEARGEQLPAAVPGLTAIRQQTLAQPGFQQLVVPRLGQQLIVAQQLLDVLGIREHHHQILAEPDSKNRAMLLPQLLQPVENLWNKKGHLLQYI